MALTSYTTLKASIADFLNRTDLTAVIPDFITLLEAELKRHDAIEYERRDTIVLNAQSVTLPTDCREVRSLYFDDATRRYPIELRTPEEINPTRLGPLVAGIPKFAAVHSNGSALLISPTPDASYTAWIVYLTTLTSLSATTATNWVLTDHPDIYLYGSLMQAEPYLKNDERLPLWQSRLDRAYEQLNALVERRQFSGNTPILRPRLAIG